MSEVSETTVQSPKAENRSEKRLDIDQKIKANGEWLKTLEEKVDQSIMSKDEKNELIARSMVARELLTERANEKSKKDPMTGLLNKGAYKEEYDKLIDNGSPFGLLIIDIDHFKKVNDTYGHAIGDRVLIQTGQNLTTNLRQIRLEESQNDKVFRYGGEEMAVLLPGIFNEEDLEKVAEKIRTSVSESPYSVGKNGENIHIPITVSIGGGIYRQGDSDFFEKVDKEGLYKAKETGRNRTVIINK